MSEDKKKGTDETSLQGPPEKLAHETPIQGPPEKLVEIPHRKVFFSFLFFSSLFFSLCEDNLRPWMDSTSRVNRNWKSSKRQTTNK